MVQKEGAGNDQLFERNAHQDQSGYELGSQGRRRNPSDRLLGQGLQAPPKIERMI
jgi:hypothetical protein